VSSLPGQTVTDEDLQVLGFVPFDLDIERVDIALPDGVGCEWRTLGDVPNSSGLYAFTINDAYSQTVAYVGRTRHLWMVTKGYLPRSGGARGGQRYGRPRHAGITPQRINILITAELGRGNRVRHWLRPTPASELILEEALIRRWQLHEIGWNLR